MCLGNFGDALNRLAARVAATSTPTASRYWYDTKPNLNREAADRAQRYEEYQVASTIDDAIKALVRQRGGFRAVHVTGAGSDVPDEDAVRLVVLPYRDGFKRTQGDGAAAIKLAQAILANRGNIPRTHKNMLIFLAADQDAAAAMTDTARKVLAWSSIVKDGDSGKLNLDNYGRSTATAQLKEAQDALPRRIDEAYKWIIAPEQVTGTDPWTFRAEPRNGGIGDSLAEKVFRKLESDGTVITRWSPAVLKLELDKWFFTTARHVGTKKVWDTLTSYGYVPRLKDSSVLDETMFEGSKSTDYFGYATSVSPDGRYEGLIFGASGRVIVDPHSVLVRPDAAHAQIEADARARSEREESIGGRSHTPTGGGTDVGTRTGTGTGTSTGATITPPAERVFTRYWASIQLDPSRPIPAFEEIVQDVIQHLTAALGANVEITLEVQATSPTGFTDATRRTVSENAKTLKFKSSEFSDS